MRKLENGNAAPAGRQGGVENQGTFSEGPLITTSPNSSPSPREFAAAVIASRWHLPAPTARTVVELARLGGQAA
jgi:hypothetical protein